MVKQNFGSLLREYRLKSHNPKTKKPITQQELGEFLREETGVRYSGAAVSDWENDKSKIDASYRSVLVSIIKILKKHGGIRDLSEANQLLEAGNYRDLKPNEQQEIFPDVLIEGTPQHKNENQAKNSKLLDFVKIWFFDSPKEFEQVWKKVNEGPPPPWPRLVVSIINKNTDKLSPSDLLTLIVWGWIFVVFYFSIIPSFRFPFATQQIAFSSMVIYALGSLLLPLGIGFVVNIKDNPFWKAQSLEKTFILRFYIVIGAYMGFHVSYFLVFLLVFILKHLQIQFGVWSEIFIILFVLMISYGSAQLIPYNFWLVYKKLALKEGKILLSFIVLGIFWAWFFLEFYDTLVSSILGLIAVLIALTILVVFEIRKQRKPSN